MFTVYW